MSGFLDIIGGLSLVAGAVFLLLGGIGLNRMPDSFGRIQVGAKTTTLGTILVLVGAGFIQPDMALKLFLIGVFLLLSFLFRSYIEPLLVMLVIPLSLSGAIFGHMAMGLDFSMPSMLGFIALAGVVVNNSILLVYFVKHEHGNSETVAEAAAKAARARFRAIFLTSLTTIAGVLPILTEKRD